MATRKARFSTCFRRLRDLLKLVQDILEPSGEHVRMVVEKKLQIFFHLVLSFFIGDQNHDVVGQLIVNVSA